MLLTGTHLRTLDDKKRLTLPRKVREQLGEATERLYLAQGLDQCLWIYDQGGLERLAEKLDQTPATDAEARVFRRLFFAQMEAVDMDKAGRVLVPERLLEFAGLKHEVVMIGVRDHLELWDADRWQQYLGKNGPRFDAVAEASFQK
ncbi:MAG TPA: division/cell wall cluster transcriptional repressor MraZ [Gemmataceae bacterium]|jgi:MraZ protein|nr:division/cell wall cluster transcriptional repressor MraZ [Gemmataceae bacterium]